MVCQAKIISDLKLRTTSEKERWKSVHPDSFNTNIHPSISPSSKAVPSLFLIDVRMSEVKRGLGFTSAIERAEFLRRINQSFNPGSLQLRGNYFNQGFNSAQTPFQAYPLSLLSFSKKTRIDHWINLLRHLPLWGTGEVWASGTIWYRYSVSGEWQKVKAVLHGKVCEETLNSILTGPNSHLKGIREAFETRKKPPKISSTKLTYLQFLCAMNYSRSLLPYRWNALRAMLPARRLLSVIR